MLVVQEHQRWDHLRDQRRLAGETVVAKSQIARERPIVTDQNTTYTRGVKLCFKWDVCGYEAVYEKHLSTLTISSCGKWLEPKQ